MSTSIIRKNGDVITFDALLSITSGYSAKVTQKPVENGTDVTDNISTKNKAISLEGIISDATLTSESPDVIINEKSSKAIIPGFLSNFFNLGVMEQFSKQAPKITIESPALVSRYADAREKLLEIYRNREIFTLEEKDQTHYNLALTNLTFPRDKSINAAIRFNITCQEIRLVDNKIISATREAVPDNTLDGASDSDTYNGKKQPKEKDGAKESILVKTVKRIQKMLEGDNEDGN